MKKNKPINDHILDIYGIYSILKKRCIKVDLSHEIIKNEYDLSMYSSDEYRIVRFSITIDITV